jgi:hypothetical protein
MHKPVVYESECYGQHPKAAELDGDDCVQVDDFQQAVTCYVSQLDSYFQKYTNLLSSGFYYNNNYCSISPFFLEQHQKKINVIKINIMRCAIKAIDASWDFLLWNNLTVLHSMRLRYSVCLSLMYYLKQIPIERFFNHGSILLCKMAYLFAHNEMKFSSEASKILDLAWSKAQSNDEKAFVCITKALCLSHFGKKYESARKILQDALNKKSFYQIDALILNCGLRIKTYGSGSTWDDIRESFELIFKKIKDNEQLAQASYEIFKKVRYNHLFTKQEALYFLQYALNNRNSYQFGVYKLALRMHGYDDRGAVLDYYNRMKRDYPKQLKEDGLDVDTMCDCFLGTRNFVKGIEFFANHNNIDERDDMVDGLKAYAFGLPRGKLLKKW